MAGSALLRSILFAAPIALGLAVAPGRAAGPATPFDPDLMRFAEILGALAYLDGLCDGPDASAWRPAMERIIEGQRMSGDDRRRYVDVFNRGYRTFASIHRLCSDQTRLVIERYLVEGNAIAERIDERFGRGTPAASQALPQPAQ